MKSIFKRFELPLSEAEDNFPHEIDTYVMQTEITKDKQIVKTLVPGETVDVYENIQADNHGLDVYDLIKRFNAGDPNVKIGICDWNDGDFSATTMSLVEMQSIVENFGATWDSLPLDVRQHYDHDLTKFLNGVDTGEFKSYIESRNKPATSVADTDKED